MTMDLATHPASQGVSIDYDAVLKALNLNPRDPKTQALLLVCDRYGLDPVLKHIVLISGNAYVTRDGYLAVAHRSGQFDGMEVLNEGETNTHYTAKVAVYRKDMSHPFTFAGRFPKGKNMAKEYGPEMAIKVAEVQAMRRAFNVTGLGAADERWDVQLDAEPSDEPTVTEHGEIVEAEVVDNAPAAADNSRKRNMHRLFNLAGITDRDDRLAYCARNIGRDVQSSNDLSPSERDALIRQLELDTAEEPPLRDEEVA